MATAPQAGPAAKPAAPPERPALGALALYFLRLGASGFGGPIALSACMHQDLVVERAWFRAAEYQEGLALAQLAPGPLAAQLAMYLGWVRGGGAGATLVAVAFTLPSLLMVWAIAAAYVAWGGLAAIAALFYGIGPAVIAIMARAAWKLARSSLGRDRLSWAIFAVLAIATAATGREIPCLFLLAGVAAAVVKQAPGMRTGVVALAGLPAGMATGMAANAAAGAAASVTVWKLFWFFAQAGMFVFGSGLAIVPFLYGGVVEQQHWLNDRQFLDAVAVAMITPGPVVITVAFIGYLVARTPGLLAAAAGVFLPVWLVVVLAAPHFHRWSRHGGVRAFVGGVTAAATGALAGAVVVLARRTLADAPSAAIALAALLALACYGRRAGAELWTIAAAGGLGLWLR